jgi:hypothetical protein
VPVPTRRAFLASAALAALALARPLGGWLAGPRARRAGGLFLVNGWILTAEDVAALRARAG